MTEFMAFVLVMSGFLTGLVGVGVLIAVVTGLIWHYFPNCAYSRWVKAEVFQTEPLEYLHSMQTTPVRNIKVGECLKPNPNVMAEVK